MSRPAQRAKSQRVQVALRPNESPQLQPNRRNFGGFVGGFQKNVHAARALEEFFQVGTKFALQKAGEYGSKQVLLGTQAALEGREVTPEEAKRDAFMLGVQNVKADRAVLDIRAGVEELYTTFDKNEGTPEQFRDQLAGYLQDQLGGYDETLDMDLKMIERMQPHLQQIEQEYDQRYRDDVHSELSDELEGDLA